VQHAFLLNPVVSTDNALTLFETGDPSFAPQIPVAHDSNPVELGVRFTVSVSGRVDAIQFYRSVPSSSDFAVHLWDANGNLLGTGTASGDVSPGWVTVTLDVPAQLNVFQTYVASYYSSDAGYSADHNYFTNNSISRGSLLAFGSFTGGEAGPTPPNGVYHYGLGGGFPTDSYMDSNYWVSPVFHPDPSVGAAPVVTSISQTTSPTTGGTELVIEGANFTPDAISPSVYIGDVRANIHIYSPNEIFVTIPQHPAGTVDVRVVTDAGESAPTPADLITYVAPAADPAPITLFETTDPTFAPQIPVANDSNAVELGVEFTVSVPGHVSAIQFYRGAPSDTGFVVHLWDAAGHLLGSGIAAPNQAAGWQIVTLDVPVELQAHVTYVASYYTSTGGYAADQNFSFDTRGPLTAVRGVFVYGQGGGFPTETYLSSNYWVGPVFQPDTSVGLAPEIVSLSQSSASTSGGGVLFIHGSNFASTALDIYFGDVKCLNWTLIDDNTLAALIPAHAAATVDVRVITAAGETPTTLEDLFTFA
jgi:hypothetical protein